MKSDEDHVTDYRQKDNINLLAGARTKMYEDSKGNAKLIINDVQPSDAGLYFLRAENKAGKAKCAATLRVVGEEQPRVSASLGPHPYIDIQIYRYTLDRDMFELWLNATFCVTQRLI